MGDRRGRMPWTMTIVLASLTTGGCDEPPKAGGTCPMSKNGELIACEGTGAVLRCVEQKLVAVPCHGPNGCAAKSPPSCDLRLGEAGKPCLVNEWTTSEEAACSTDGTKTLLCRDKGLESRFEPGRPCRGPKGCANDAGTVRCDQTTARTGDRCNTGESSFGACSVDKTQVLACKHADASPLGSRGGTFVVERECPTAKGCQMRAVSGMADSFMPVCDYGKPEPGTKCGKGYENLELCGRDATTIVKCDPTTHTFQASRTCPDGQTCQPYDGHSDIPTCAAP